MILSRFVVNICFPLNALVEISSAKARKLDYTGITMLLLARSRPYGM